MLTAWMSAVRLLLLAMPVALASAALVLLTYVLHERQAAGGGVEHGVHTHSSACTAAERPPYTASRMHAKTLAACQTLAAPIVRAVMKVHRFCVDGGLYGVKLVGQRDLLDLRSGSCGSACGVWPLGTAVLRALRHSLCKAWIWAGDLAAAGLGPGSDCMR